MGSKFGKGADALDMDPGALLDDIELSRRADLSQARKLSAVKVEATLTVRSANVSERATALGEGVTTELRRQGVSSLLSVPMGVGSVYHLSFDDTELGVTPCLAICDRCAMLTDTAFEVNFQLLQAIELPAPTDGDS